MNNQDAMKWLRESMRLRVALEDMREQLLLILKDCPALERCESCGKRMEMNRPDEPPSTGMRWCSDECSKDFDKRNPGFWTPITPDDFKPGGLMEKNGFTTEEPEA